MPVYPFTSSRFLARALALLSLLSVFLPTGMLIPVSVRAATPFVRVADGHLLFGDQPIILKGSNFYPRAAPWQYFWTQWDGPTVAADLAQVTELGDNTVRILVPYGAAYGWTDAQTGAVSPLYRDELRQFVQLAGKQNVRVLITLFDFNGDFPAAGSAAEARQLTYLTTIVNTFRDDDRVLAWDLHNEPDNYGTWQSANDPNDALDWLARIATRTRELDPNHLVTVGAGRDTSFAQTDTAGHTLIGISDFVSLHCYNAPDLTRQITAVRALAGDKPLILEEAGWPSGPLFSTKYSEAQQATAYDTITAAARTGELAGAMQWALWDSLPFRNGAYDTFQDAFGLLHRDGSPKPAFSIWRDGFVAPSFPPPGTTGDLPLTTQPVDQAARPEFFQQTGHYVATPLQEFWRRVGGEAVFGLPLTDAFVDESMTTERKVVQVFERGRMEYYPDRYHTPAFLNASHILKYLVIIEQGHLGEEAAAAEGLTFARSEDHPRQGVPEQWFPETGHALSGAFLDYWTHLSFEGVPLGAPIFGPPISDPFVRTDAVDGKEYLVQYCRNARLEYPVGFPEQIAVARLGAELAQTQGWLDTATPGYRVPADGAL